MLNERAEFEAYITNPESSSPRIQPKLLTGNFSTDCGLYGIEQILVVLARGYIFDTYREDEIYSDGFVRPELLNDAKLFLQRWLGFHFEHADSPERNPAPSYRRQASNGTDYFREADGWFKKYWMAHCEKNEKEKEILWKNLESKWTETLSVNDYRENQITLNSVIAQALNRGSLKEQYLVFRKDPSGAPVKNKKERFSYLYSLKAGNDGKIHTLYEKTRERLLKNIAAYLLSQKYHPKGQTFVLLYRGQLLNWYGIDDAKGARSIWYFPRCVWGLETKEQIMEAYSRESQWNFIKFSVNQAFLSYFDFHLIDPSQACDVNTSKYWILQDMGHGSKSLRCLNE